MQEKQQKTQKNQPKTQNDVKNQQKTQKIEEKSLKNPKIGKKEEKTSKKTTKISENSSKNTKNSRNKPNIKEKTQKNLKKIEKNEDFKNEKISGFHDLKLNTYFFDNVKNPKASVLVIHGMQEHCTRYFGFAKFLNEHGYIAVLSDLRGHGETAISKDKLGFGEKDIFTETLADQKILLDEMKKRYNLPIYLFGHSYGSFLSQVLVQQCPQIEKAVICGTADGGDFIFALGNFVVSLLSPFKKYDSKGGLVEKLCIKAYGKKFERGNWLTRDEKVFDEYLKDEYCGGSFPFSFYKSMIKNLRKANKKIGDIKGKIFLIVGDHDPVGGKSKQVKKLQKRYEKKNIDSKIKVYQGARHELLNETNKDEVYQDILDFYEN